MEAHTLLFKWKSTLSLIYLNERIQIDRTKKKVHDRRSLNKKTETRVYKKAPVPRKNR